MSLRKKTIPSMLILIGIGGILGKYVEDLYYAI